MEPLDTFMTQALAQARLAVGLSEPNPRVGCLIVAADGRRVLGQGHTQRAGEAHAEIMALRAAAGIANVVASLADPKPLVAGEGFSRLRAAGVDVVTGPGAAESRELNIGFFSRMVRQTPWVRMKIAASLDGKTALDNGASQWITSPQARADGHAWRARAG